MSGAIYTPSEWGTEFHSARAHELLGAGAAGPGKTYALRADFLPQLKLEDYRARLPEHDPRHIDPGSSKGWWLYLRRTNNMLAQEIVHTEQMFRRLCPEVTWRGDESGGRTYVFPPSGFRYQLGAMHDIGAYQNYMSNEYTGIAADELVQFDEEQIDQVWSRVRTDDELLIPMLRRVAMSNPLMGFDTKSSFTVRDPEWVRRRFIDPAPEGRVRLVRKVVMDDGDVLDYTSMYLPARLSDNPNRLFRRQYELSLQTKPPHIRQALLRGDWYVTIGAFYSEVFNEEIHRVKPFAIPRSWGRCRAMDWGFRTPGCAGWFAESPDGEWVQERELTFQGMKADAVAREIIAIETEMGLWDTATHMSRIGGVADDQLWEQRGDIAQTKAEVFAEAGIQWVKADKNHKRACELITDHLADKSSGIPALVFFENCRRTVLDIKTVRADPHDPETVLDTRHNHWHDMLMYFANYASRGLEVPAWGRDDAWGWMDPDDRKRPDRGRTGYGI